MQKVSKLYCKASSVDPNEASGELLNAVAIHADRNTADEVEGASSDVTENVSE